MQPFTAAGLSAKFLVVVPLSGTTTPATCAELKPDALAVSLGYVPAGTLNEYWPDPFVVVVRLPRDTIAPAIGRPFPRFVTVPLRVPFPMALHPGNWNAPTRVWWSSPSTA